MTDTLKPCPQCGEDTATFHEGYCRECCDDNQRRLDEHNAAFDAWERLNVRQRNECIKAASIAAWNRRA